MAIICRNCYQEISHLLITNCDLRVLVTYPDGNEIEDQMNYLHDLICKVEGSTSYCTSESILVILGHRTADLNKIEWEAYIYKEIGWKELQ